jgi:glycosyltransferase involved in cell wall biosynthesis
MTLAKLRRQRVVIFWPSTLLTNAYRGGHPIARARRRMLRAADAVLTVGVASAEAAAANGVVPDKIITGFNTVDNEGLRRQVLHFRSTLEPRKQGHHYVFVGQLIERKQAKMALSSFGAIAEAGDELDIVGNGPEFRSLAERPELAAFGGRVRMLGDLRGDALSRVYARAQTLVLPSHTEVWGLVANEALACGLHAAISSRAGCARDVEGMRGVFVCEPTQDGLSRAMAASREAWTGYIPDPEILKYSSATQADEALRACRVAASAT